MLMLTSGECGRASCRPSISGARGRCICESDGRAVFLFGQIVMDEAAKLPCHSASCFGEWPGRKLWSAWPWLAEGPCACIAALEVVVPHGSSSRTCMGVCSSEPVVGRRRTEQHCDVEIRASCLAGPGPVRMQHY